MHTRLKEHKTSLTKAVSYTHLKKLSSLGDSTISSYAKSFAKSEYKACGKDLDKLQTDYMFKTGAKMISMTLLMVIAAILVGFFASKTAAGVGRDLREKIFTKVMSFSNAELDKFSTASLITRSTNDVQQIQMVSVMLLRMVLYAPILAIGGIINVVNYSSGTVSYTHLSCCTNSTGSN